LERKILNMSKGSIVKHQISTDYLKDLKDGKIPKGIKIDCKLDAHLRFKVGKFNVILGHANVGKTAWMFWYFLMIAVKHGKRFLVFASENGVEEIKRDLIVFYTQKEFEKIEDSEFYSAKAAIDSMFDFIDIDHLYSYKDLLDAFEKHKIDYDGFLIDPYNSLIKDKGLNLDSHSYDYQAATELRIWARTNKKTIYVIAHAVTEALRKTYHKEHEYAGFPLPPNAADIEGGGKWVNRADDFIVIHRLTQHKTRWMITEIHVKKVKDTYSGGKPTFIDEPVEFKMHYGNRFLCAEDSGIDKDPYTAKKDDGSFNNLEINHNFDEAPF